jgi:hypothetical protein
MFIRKGTRRINMNYVREYHPSERTLSTGQKTYSINIIYIDGTKDSYEFYNNPTERDNLLKKFDDSFLKEI